MTFEGSGSVPIPKSVLWGLPRLDIGFITTNEYIHYNVFLIKTHFFALVNCRNNVCVEDCAAVHVVLSIVLVRRKYSGNGGRTHSHIYEVFPGGVRLVELGVHSSRDIHSRYCVWRLVRFALKNTRQVGHHGGVVY
jgi:hypothetical protein